MIAEDSPLWLAVPLIVLSSLGLTIVGWELVREIAAGRCPRCSNGVANLDNVFSLRRPRWCDTCDLLLRSEEFETFAGEWCIDDEKMLTESDPAVKCLSMWMLLSMCGRVDELSFIPEEGDYHCQIRVGGKFYEMDPLASLVHGRLTGLSRAIWKCDSANEINATEKIVVRCGDRSATAVAEFTPGLFGDRVVFRFSDHRPLN
ncbi:hypothetical protein NG895_19055 [Aeoliella sp. ICT_H6.2]|uniref:Uncharacterized protein n=1 Tax=Aeoliella straminimaris TaxID=2954799 RepID=A0A9X2JIS7_9BACT|nr:hypothetical protein [Aeoliella straminimaris]MCO6046003.1 hypothetical protein [Aeoliella straminimaris]